MGSLSTFGALVGWSAVCVSVFYISCWTFIFVFLFLNDLLLFVSFFVFVIPLNNDNWLGVVV